MKYLTFLFFVFALMSCDLDTANDNSSSSDLNAEEIQDTTETDNLTQSKNVAPPPSNGSEQNQHPFNKSLQAGKVNFNVSCENGEKSTIHVDCDGLEVRKYEKDFPIEGQLKDAFSLDLDGDGFYEIYLVVKGKKLSSNLEIIGIASYNDKSAGEIYVKDVTTPRQSDSDIVFVENEKLIREFRNEKNELLTFNYNLKKGEAGFILEPEKVN